MTGISPKAEAAIERMRRPAIPSIKVKYRNWKGVTSVRTIRPMECFYGSTQYHPKNSWLLRVWDEDKSAVRIYSLADCDFTGGDA